MEFYKNLKIKLTSIENEINSLEKDLQHFPKEISVGNFSLKRDNNNSSAAYVGCISLLNSRIQASKDLNLIEDLKHYRDQKTQCINMHKIVVRLEKANREYARISDTISKVYSLLSNEIKISLIKEEENASI